MKTVFVIEPEEIMAECIARAVGAFGGIGASDFGGFSAGNFEANENEAGASKVTAKTEAGTEKQGARVRIFRDGIAAMEAISEGEIPDLIFLEVFLDGPDGFTFLNELVSYPDTARIPVVIISSVEFREEELQEYSVVKCLLKEKMRPEEIFGVAREYLRAGDLSGGENGGFGSRADELKEIAKGADE